MNFLTFQSFFTLISNSSKCYKEPSPHFLLVQTKQWKHQNNVWNLFKVIYKNIKTSFWCLFCELWTGFTHCFDVSVVDFKQVPVGNFQCFKNLRTLLTLYWYPLTGHTYLSKPVSFSCTFKYVWSFSRRQALKGYF